MRAAFKMERETLEPVQWTQEDQEGRMTEYHGTLLDDPAVEQCLGALFTIYERRYYYWSVIQLLKMFASTGMVVIIRVVASKYDLIFALGVAIVFLLLQAHYSPHVNLHLNQAEYAMQASLVVTLF